MTNVAIRAGGMPVPSDVLVSTDGTTIQGDGSARNPLHAGSGATSVVADGITIQGNGTTDSPLQAIGTGEFISTNVSTVIDPDIPVSLVNRPSGGAGGVTLADPGADTPDNFLKQIACLPYVDGIPGAVAYVISCTLRGGFSSINVITEGGGVTLLWDGGFWNPIGGFNAEQA